MSIPVAKCRHLLLSKYGRLHPFLLPVFVSRNSEIRKLFLRIFYKKNGLARREFSLFIKELEEKRASERFVSGSPIFQFFPDHSPGPRLNIVFHLGENDPFDRQEKASLLTSSIEYALSRDWALRLLTNKDVCPRHLLGKVIREASVGFQNVEILEFRHCRVNSVGVGDIEYFACCQKHIWEALTGGYALSSGYIDLSKDLQRLS